MRVAICICTFKRPDLLRHLLGGILGLKFRKVQKPQIKVVIVDNDEHATARAVCHPSTLPWPMQYVVEPRRGITYGRNRAIAEAGEVDFIAFIDDDEVPAAGWLDELLCTYQEYSADIVCGPVFPKYASEVPEWVKSGGFFEPRSFVTGQERNTSACNNVLIASHVFKCVPGFDHAFAVSGAEDTNFFLQAHKVGHKIVWSQEAVVFESVPVTRGNVPWILRRAYQTGNGWVFCEAGIDGRLRKRAVRLLRACGHVVIGSAKAIWGALSFDKAGVVRALQRVSLGAGMFAAVLGHRFLAYRTAGSEPGKRHAAATFNSKVQSVTSQTSL